MTKLKVAYLGPKNTYTEAAAQLMFPNSELTPLAQIDEVMLAVEQDQVHYSVVPFENVYDGKQTPVLDTFSDLIHEAGIVRETFIPIFHCFGALKGCKNITKVYSKDTAFSQCRTFLRERYPGVKLIPMGSTAAGAVRIKEGGEMDAGVIASKEALMENGLEVLADGFCPNNKTRFFALSKYSTKPTGDDKTLVSFHPHITDEAGVLHSCLTPLKLFGINMGAILERPDRNPIQRGYHFFIELTGHQNDFLVKRALQDVKIYLDRENKFPDAVRVFGSYPNSHWDEPQKT